MPAGSNSEAEVIIREIYRMIACAKWGNARRRTASGEAKDTLYLSRVLARSARANLKRNRDGGGCD